MTEEMGFNHASVDMRPEDYPVFWEVSLEVVTRDLPDSVYPAFEKFFEFLEKSFSMGLEEASAESLIIKSCRLDMRQIGNLQVSAEFEMWMFSGFVFGFLFFFLF